MKQLEILKLTVIRCSSYRELTVYVAKKIDKVSTRLLPYLQLPNTKPYIMCPSALVTKRPLADW